MNTPTKSPEFLLLVRGGEWDKNLSPEKIQDAMGRLGSWMDKLTAEGKFKAGQPLETESKIISGKNGRMVADGPFAETKESVGGYFLLTVDTFEEAVEIAQAFPMLEFGAILEVRPIAEVCPMMRQYQQEHAAALA